MLAPSSDYNSNPFLLDEESSRRGKPAASAPVASQGSSVREADPFAAEPEQRAAVVPPPAQYAPSSSYPASGQGCGATCCACMRETFSRRPALAFLLVALFVSCFVLFIVSAVQHADSTNAGPDCPDEGTCATSGRCSQIQVYTPGSSCDGTTLAAYAPIRFVLKPNEDYMLRCGWPTTESFWRMGLTFCALPFLALVAYLVYKDRTGWLVCCVIISGAATACTFFSATLDANRARIGSSDCADQLKNALPNMPDRSIVECHQWIFVSTVLWNYGHMFLWGLFTYSLLVYRNARDSERAFATRV